MLQKHWASPQSRKEESAYGIQSNIHFIRKIKKPPSDNQMLIAQALHLCSICGHDMAHRKGYECETCKTYLCKDCKKKENHPHELKKYQKEESVEPKEETKEMPKSQQKEEPDYEDIVGGEVPTRFGVKYLFTQLTSIVR